LDIIRNGMTRDAAAAADALKLHENSTEILAMLQQAERESRSQR
jgi:hypothetical protein